MFNVFEYGIGLNPFSFPELSCLVRVRLDLLAFSDGESRMFFSMSLFSFWIEDPLTIDNFLFRFLAIP